MRYCAYAEQCFMCGRTHRRRVLRRQGERLRAYVEAHLHGQGILLPHRSGKAETLSAAPYMAERTGGAPCASGRANGCVHMSKLIGRGRAYSIASVRQSGNVKRRSIHGRTHRRRALRQPARAPVEHRSIYGRAHRRRALRRQGERLRAYVETHWQGQGILLPHRSGKAETLSAAPYMAERTGGAPCQRRAGQRLAQAGA